MGEYVAAMWFYVVFSAFGLVGLPIASRIFPARRGLAYVVAKPLGLVMFGYAIWLFASLHILDYQAQWVISGLLVIAMGAGGWFSRGFFREAPLAMPQSKKEKRQQAKQKPRIPLYKKVLWLEVAVIALYLGYLVIRSYSAGANGTERFMDMMLLTAAGHTHSFPFIDSWYAGKTINYYYYGSYLMSLLSNVAHVPYALSYTFSLALVYVQSALLSAAIVFTLTRSRVFALLGPFLVTTAGTLFFAIKTMVAAFGGQVYSYASSTRLYDPSYIINEIPSYSFTVGDLHAHLLALPFFLVGLALLYAIALSERPRRLLFGILALALATSGMINMWDLVTLASLLGVLMVVKTAYEARAAGARLQWIIAGGTTLITAIILMAPYLAHFQNPTLGLGFIPSYVAKKALVDAQWPTPFLAEIGMWGVFIVGIAMAVACARTANPAIFGSRTEPAAAQRREGALRSAEPKIAGFAVRDIHLLLTLIIVSIGIIVGVELFFIKDIYSVTNPPYFRANTTFKFGYHAWTMLCIVFAVAMYTLMRMRGAARWIGTALVGASLAAGIVYPYQAIKQFYLPSTGPRTLDGSAWMRGHSAEDLAAIHWINDHLHERVVIAEAVGDSYSWYGRISVFTGMIAPMGWKSHEWTWRFDGRAAEDAPMGTTVETGWGPVSVVGEDIRQLYETTDASVARKIIQKYGIQYVYIGAMEREAYPNLSDEKFTQIGSAVFRAENSVLFAVAES